MMPADGMCVAAENGFGTSRWATQLILAAFGTARHHDRGIGEARCWGGLDSRSVASPPYRLLLTPQILRNITKPK